MLESLSDRLQWVFSGLKSKGRLKEDDINSAMREIRLVLLEADVNFIVAKKFIDATKERCITAEVFESLTPSQNVIKIVQEELTALLGKAPEPLNKSNRIPQVIMIVGLQGSGKTTAAAKLAYMLKNRGHSPLLVACDIHRPAAADQLQTLGEEIEVRVFRDTDMLQFAGPKSIHAQDIAKAGVQNAIDNLHDYMIVDTAGRLHVDEEMMQEVRDIKEAVAPEEVLMVVDAMIGQDAVKVSNSFAEEVDFTGFVISKMDSDARGGAVLSAYEVTHKPIKFISAGEKPDSLEKFYPDRMAKRILGMGDMLTLIEKAAQLDEEEVEEAEAERMMRGQITLDDFLDMNKKVKKMGGIARLMSAVPGGEKVLGQCQVNEGTIEHMTVIINSMSKEERQRPEILNASRRSRIAQGSGTSVADVNQLIKKFNDVKKMMRRFSAGMGVETGGLQAGSDRRHSQRTARSKKISKKNHARRRTINKLSRMGKIGDIDMLKLEDLARELEGK
ncbi:MAG: signal recognition particle protein [Eggerthellaceae bacterium]|nr:signal recognition particle protein [Eggerthellaceae bacterium]